MKLNLAILMILSIVVSSCIPSESGEPLNDTKPVNESKTLEKPADLEDTYWKMVQVNGQEIVKDALMEKDMHFRLYSKDHRVTGFIGCNSFYGVYVPKDGMRIKFSNLGSSKKVCPNLKIKENEILNVFGLVDNYTLNGNTLSFYVGKRGPLAVFETAKSE